MYHVHMVTIAEVAGHHICWTQSEEDTSQKLYGIMNNHTHDRFTAPQRHHALLLNLMRINNKHKIRVHIIILSNKNFQKLPPCLMQPAERSTVSHCWEVEGTNLLDFLGKNQI